MIKGSKLLYLQILLGFALLAIVSCAVADQAQSTASSRQRLTELLQTAREACWVQTYHGNHPNLLLMQCDNRAVRAAVFSRMMAGQRVILNRFLDERITIAVQLDNGNITADEYKSELSDAASRMQKELKGIPI